MNVTAETATTTSDDVASNVSLILGEMGHAASRIDYAQVSRLADEISGAERVFLAGAGRSGLVLRMAAMRLMHLGKTVHVAGDTTTPPAINAGDLLIVASGSGTTSGVVKAAQTALSAGGAQVAAITTNPSSPLAGLAQTVVVIPPAAQKTDHGSDVSQQYSGSLFEQSLFLVTEAFFHSLWGATDEPAEQLWLRHANLE